MVRVILLAEQFYYTARGICPYYTACGIRRDKCRPRVQTSSAAAVKRRQTIPVYRPYPFPARQFDRQFGAPLPLFHPYPLFNPCPFDSISGIMCSSISLRSVASSVVQKSSLPSASPRLRVSNHLLFHEKIGAPGGRALPSSPNKNSSFAPLCALAVKSDTPKDRQRRSCLLCCCQ